MPDLQLSRRSLLKASATCGAALSVGLPLTGTAASATANKIDVAIYVDDHVYETHRYDPAFAAQTLFGRALEYNDIFDYAVTVVRDHSFDVRELSAMAPCDDILPEFDGWLKQNDLKPVHENHHLIYHSDESLGGCAWPRVSVGWGETLGEMDTFDPDRYATKTRGTRDDALGDTVQTTMHEISHTLGLDHHNGMHYDASYDVHGDPSLPGGSGDVYTTPQGAPFDGENHCDQSTVAKPGSSSEEYADAFYWYDCEGAKLRSNFDRRHLLTVAGADDGDWEAYSFTVSGEIVEKSGDCDASINDHDDVTDNTVNGWTHSGRDSYVFTGKITDFVADAGVSVYIDCEEVLVDSVGHNIITIEGSDDGDWESFEFTVAGGLRKTDANGASVNQHDEVDSRSVDGWTYSGKDSYHYWGGVKKTGLDLDSVSYSFSSN